MINHELVLYIAEKKKDMTLRKEQMLETLNFISIDKLSSVMLDGNAGFKIKLSN